MKKLSLVLLLNLGLILGVPTLKAEDSTPTKDDVLAAVRGWCDGLLLISEANREGNDPTAVATEILTKAYAYDDGKVLFKPTLAFGDQTFRLTKEGALAYFVGGNPDFPNDSGFALKDWKEADFTTAGVITKGNLGIYMGNVMFTDGDGNVTTVDKTFVFDFSNPEQPKIILHKSALPFKPGTTEEK